jgi:hypothetical protein
VRRDGIARRHPDTIVRRDVLEGPIKVAVAERLAEVQSCLLVEILAVQNNPLAAILVAEQNQMCL